LLKCIVAIGCPIRYLAHYLDDSFVGAGHAREQKNNRGQGPLLHGSKVCA